MTDHAKKISAAAQAFNKAVQAAASDGMKVEWWTRKTPGQPAMVDNITVLPISPEYRPEDLMRDMDEDLQAWMDRDRE